MHLIIGNKLYSSWSLRPWMLMKALNLPFSETVIALYQDDTKARIAAHSPGGKVPVLEDHGIHVWETLAITEYLHDKFPDAGVWPKTTAARANARSIASEMHAGFQPLRQACPMNLGRKFALKVYGDDVKASVERIEQLWRDARKTFGKDGPFLYGRFCAADAMYAPIVTRLDSYSWPVAADTRTYMNAVLSHPAFVAWRHDALKEPWHLPHYEAGHTVVETYTRAKS